MRRKDENLDVRRLLPDRFDHPESVERWEMKIEQHQIRVGPGNDLHGARSVLRFSNHVMVKIVDTDLSQHLAKHQMVFNNYNPHGSEWGCFGEGLVAPGELRTRQL